MTGAYISATTAFVVVNEFLPGIMAWFLPGIAGAFTLRFGSTSWIKMTNEAKNNHHYCTH
ncbi:MAG: hypothetical protein IPN29_03390 [Saprospiraceae bacterium]|nr:hypothetical protein [Saprospiraceae bacterium]